MASFFVFPDGYSLLAAKRKTGGGKNEIPGGKKSSGGISKKNEVLPDDCQVETDTYLM